MYKYTITHNNKEYARIDKREARRLYNAGRPVIVIADNLRPFTQWHCEIEISNKDQIENTDFDKRINYFEVYNCINRETGYHATFYREV